MKAKLLLRILYLVVGVLILHGCALTDDSDLIVEKLESRLNSLHTSAASISLFGVDGVIWSKTFGRISNDSEEKPNDDTLFKLASLSKIITGIAAMQLYEKGLIDLHKDINNYLPFSVRNPNYTATPISMHMLLTHSSSIKDNWIILEDNFKAEFSPEKELPGLMETCEEYFTVYGKWYNREKNFINAEPGIQTEYSNMALTLTALIIQEVSGLSFEDYCSTEIFSPMGITGGWNLLPQETVNMAFPANYNYEEVAAYGSAAFPAGFFSCSSKDFAALISIFFNSGFYGTSQILKKETVKLMLTKQSCDFYYIWKPTGFTCRGETLIHHTGGMDGTRTGVFLSGKNKIGMVILASGEFDFPYTYFDIIQILMDYGRELK